MNTMKPGKEQPVRVAGGIDLEDLEAADAAVAAAVTEWAKKVTKSEKS